MVPRFQIAGVVTGSEADRKGLRGGDVVVSYGDRLSPTNEQLQEINKSAADTGTEIVIERDGKVLPAIRVVPERKKDAVLLGVVPYVEQRGAIVGSVRAGSWADKAGIQRASVIRKINGQAVTNWADVFAALKAGAGKEVTLAFRPHGGKDADTTERKIDKLGKDLFDPADYTSTLFVHDRTNLSHKMVTIRKEGIGEALAWGARETGVWIVTAYASLKSLITRTVSTKDVLGPIGMGSIAIETATRSFLDFVYFMAVISASIAVLNFLPLPVVDGGHAVFLLIEKIRGKPVPLKVMNIVQMIGLVLLLGVFALVCFQDIMRLL
jgi:regulator of sigma E protease